MNQNLIYCYSEEFFIFLLHIFSFQLFSLASLHSVIRIHACFSNVIDDVTKI